MALASLLVVASAHGCDWVEGSGGRSLVRAAGDAQTLLVVTHEADVARRGGTTAAMSDGALTVVKAGPKPAATTASGRTS